MEPLLTVTLASLATFIPIDPEVEREPPFIVREPLAAVIATPVAVNVPPLISTSVVASFSHILPL